MKEHLRAIQEIMDQLQDEMQYDEDDFSSRLGREKPKGIEIVKIEGKGMPGEDEMEEAEEMAGKDLDGDMEMGEDPEHAAMVMDDESPEEKLKRRLMKMRG